MSIDNENKKYEFDIALSFAGEERLYVEIVANELIKNDISVFYDKYEKIDLWGKFLPDQLTEIYSRKALFCVIFISENYAKKVWTNHERKSAMSRAIRQNDEYILPARFDSTELIGLQDNSYIDLMEYSSYQFAEIIIDKLKNTDNNNLKTRLNNYIPKSDKFNYTLDFPEILILEKIDDSRYRYRAISKIAGQIGEEKEKTRERMNFLRGKGLVDIVNRPKGKKWTITNDGKEYLNYYYHELDESSDSGSFESA